MHLDSWFIKLLRVTPKLVNNKSLRIQNDNVQDFFKIACMKIKKRVMSPG